MWRRWLLLSCVTLLVTRGVVSQHCRPCQQVDCRPLPPNCKYGVTLDHCGCCNICVQRNGERCRFIPAANGVGFMCEWGSFTSASEQIGDMIASQIHHPPGLDAFLRAFFKDIPSPFQDLAELLRLNGPVKHFEQGLERAKHSALNHGLVDAKHSAPNYGLEDAKHSALNAEDTKHSAPNYIHGPGDAKHSELNSEDAKHSALNHGLEDAKHSAPIHGPEDAKHSAHNGDAKHSAPNHIHGPEDTEVTNDVEYNKAYPTCGLYDYLTSKATPNHHETSTEQDRKTNNKQVDSGNFNLRLSQKNVKSPFIDSERFVATRKANEEANEIPNSTDKLRKKKTKKEKYIEKSLRLKNNAFTFMNALKHVEESGEGSYLRQYKNINSGRQGSAKINDVSYFAKYGGHNDEKVMKASDKALGESGRFVQHPPSNFVRKMLKNTSEKDEPRKFVRDHEGDDKGNVVNTRKLPSRKKRAMSYERDQIPMIRKLERQDGSTQLVLGQSSNITQELPSRKKRAKSYERDQIPMIRKLERQDGSTQLVLGQSSNITQELPSRKKRATPGLHGHFPNIRKIQDLDGSVQAVTGQSSNITQELPSRKKRATPGLHGHFPNIRKIQDLDGSVQAVSGQSSIN